MLKGKTGVLVLCFVREHGKDGLVDVRFLRSKGWGVSTYCVVMATIEMLGALDEGYWCWY